nr:MAG TPA: hypothetical protein [Caudoviricetes sp.]
MDTISTLSISKHMVYQVGYQNPTPHRTFLHVGSP